MDRKKRVSKIGLKVTLRILIAQVIVFAGLFIFINHSVSTSTRESAINSMQTVALDRSEIIKNYVQSAENSLTSYLKADQIRNLLENQGNAGYAAAAQAYTEDFSKGLPHLEGVYASTWGTQTLTHTNPGSIGITTRPTEDRRKQLHDAILATDGVYNTGILISPASGQQIISMYKAVKDRTTGNPVGLGGIGIYTSGLVDTLNSLPLDGMPGAEYYLVNINTGEHIFHPDAEKIAKVAEEQYINDIIAQVKGRTMDTCSYTTYKDKGTSYIAAYSTMNEYGWVFIIADKEAEVFAAANALRLILMIICIASIVVLSAVVYAQVNLSIRPIKSIENAIVKLGRIELDAAADVARFTSRKDEIGSIARAVDTLCVNLKGAVDDIRRVLGEIAAENLTVDTQKNRNLYIGDFSILATDLDEIKDNLVQVIGNIYTASERVDSSSAQVASAAHIISQGSQEQASSVDEMVDGMIRNISDVSGSARSTSDNCDEARVLTEKMADYVAEVNGQMQNLSEAINNINSTSDKIGNIIKTIEDIAFQTNILALNAAVEAARAGKAGKGFAVVADEVRNLAGKSAQAVQDTTVLIEQSVDAVNNGVGIMRQTSGAMQTLDEYTVSVKRIVADIAESNGAQVERVAQLDKDVTFVSGVVRSNSETAVECATAAKELSDQASVLKDLIGGFRLES